MMSVFLMEEHYQKSCQTVCCDLSSRGQHAVGIMMIQCCVICSTKCSQPGTLQPVHAILHLQSCCDSNSTLLVCLGMARLVSISTGHLEKDSVRDLSKMH